MTTHIPSLTLPRAVFEQPAASVLLPVLLGTAVGFGLSPDKTKSTYRQLKQPPLNPPAWVFGPVWTALYASMGYAAYRAWTIGSSSFDPRVVDLAKHGATLYTIQLGLNLIWTPLFFGISKPILAAADIVTLTGTVGYLASVWSKIDPVSAWLLAPYLGWLGFATYLNFGCGIKNNWDFSSAVQGKKIE